MSTEGYLKIWTYLLGKLDLSVYFQLQFTAHDQAFKVDGPYLFVFLEFNDPLLIF